MCPKESLRSDMVGNTQNHPWTLLLRHVASHTLRASMSEFDWFMPIAVKIPNLQATENYSSQRKQRHFSWRSQWEGCCTRQKVGSSRQWPIEMKPTTSCRNRLVLGLFVLLLRLSWLGSESIHWGRDNFLKWNVLVAGPLCHTTPGDTIRIDYSVNDTPSGCTTHNQYK